MVNLSKAAKKPRPALSTAEYQAKMAALRSLLEAQAEADLRDPNVVPARVIPLSAVLDLLGV